MFSPSIDDEVQNSLRKGLQIRADLCLKFRGQQHLIETWLASGKGQRKMIVFFTI